MNELSALAVITQEFHLGAVNKHVHSSVMEV